MMQARYDSVPVHLHFIMCHANTESITKRSQRSRMLKHLTQKALYFLQLHVKTHPFNMPMSSMRFLTRSETFSCKYLTSHLSLCNLALVRF